MHTNFGRYALNLFSIAVLLSFSTFAASLNGGGQVTLPSTSPVALATGNGNPSNLVNKIRVQVIPGQSCKIYVGPLALASSTNNAFAVLFPNATGGWSEMFELQDPRGFGDGIDLSKIYVKTDCPGEGFIFHWYQLGTPLALVDQLKAKRYGLFINGNANSSITASVDPAVLVNVRVLPGHVGKINVGNATYKMGVLFPNTGNPGQNNAGSESWTLADKSGTIRPWLLNVWADVPGEGALVTIWGV